jgi:L-rhamnose-H+ transport protein
MLVHPEESTMPRLLSRSRNVPTHFPGNPSNSRPGSGSLNFIYCVALNIKNRSGADYLNREAPLRKNYALAASAGLLWYIQFMFYGMGSTRLGDYAFAAWSVLMAVVVAVSNLWGLYFKEWHGVSRRTIGTICTGILLVLLSILLIGAGGYVSTR